MKKKALHLILCLFAAISMSAQVTYTVTSPDDSGTGTLRKLIENAEAGDEILIPGDYSIVLESPLVCEKQISINGQGATLKVAEPGTTKHRLFILGSTKGTATIDIKIENLKMQGGDVRLNADEEGTAPTHGGAILVLKRVNLIMNNCEITDSQAARGGAIHVNDGVGVSAAIENCIFKNNNASEYGGACSFMKSQSQTDGPGEAVFNNTLFEANTSTGSAAITMNIPCTFTGCLFKDNKASGTSRGSCVFQVNDNPSGNCRLNECTFAGNSTGAIDPAANQDGGIFVAQKGQTTTYFLTNCTFYDNHGGRGAVYLFAGKMFMVNCTVTGNVSYNRNVYAGGFYATTDGTAETKEAVFVNNIFAYNYSLSMATDAVEPTIQVLDTYFGAKPIIDANTNIIASAKRATDAPVTISNPVPFFYDPEGNPDFDDPLFESYTANKHGSKIPVYDPETRTIALEKDGIATGQALSKDDVIDPEIEALIPVKDQRGVDRGVDPSLGAYEYVGGNSIGMIDSDNVTFIAVNPAVNQLQLNNGEQINRVDILDLTGKVLLSANQPGQYIGLHNISTGHYVVRLETFLGTYMEKLIVK